MTDTGQDGRFSRYNEDAPAARPGRFLIHSVRGQGDDLVELAPCFRPVVTPEAVPDDPADRLDRLRR